MSPDEQEHWQRVYTAKLPTDVSWYQPIPERSLRLIRDTGIPVDAPLLDVGGGACTLVDALLAEGYTDLTVLDLSARALQHAQERLGPDAAARVTWSAADILTFRPERRYTVWHDRAVLHFLTDEARRSAYVNTLHHSLAPQGHVILATFGPGGPERCSGLPVQRYSVEELDALLGTGFQRGDDATDIHRTPSGAEQQFTYGRWRATS